MTKWRLVLKLSKKVKLATALILIMGFSTYGYTCYKTKQCCKRDYTGNLSCVTKCDYERCPYDYPTEIK